MTTFLISHCFVAVSHDRHEHGPLRGQIAETQVIVQRSARYRCNNAERCSRQSVKPESGCVKGCCAFTRGQWMRPRLMINLQSYMLALNRTILIRIPDKQLTPCTLSHFIFSFFLSERKRRDLHCNKRLSWLIAFIGLLLHQRSCAIRPSFKKM